mgnify:CR=1 FL=1
MADYIVMFRNFLIALILGWLGFSLQPDDGGERNTPPQDARLELGFVR